MSGDAHIRCNEMITKESILRDTERDPELRRLWEEADVDLDVYGNSEADPEYYYDEVRELFPRYRVNLCLHNTMLAERIAYSLGDHERVYRTLKWFAGYLRQLVKRSGEVWYTENWLMDDVLHRRDLKVITYDVSKEICFMRYEDSEFRFATDTFYRFVDGSSVRYGEITFGQYVWCSERITYESMNRDCLKSPLLCRLWNEACIEVTFEDDPADDEYYGKVRGMFPKIRSSIHLRNTMVIADSCSYTSEDRVITYRTILWFAEYIRQLVKRSGEVWYAENWTRDGYLERKDMKVITFDVNKEMNLMDCGDAEFRFASDTFYRFIDGE